MLLWLAEMIGETAFGAFLKPIFARLFPSADERLGEAEQANKDTKEAQNVEKAINSVSPVSPDDTVKRLSDDKF